MSKQHGILTPVLLMLLVSGPSSAGTLAAQKAFTFHEPVDGVIAAVVNPEVPSYAFANSLFVIGEDGVLVVDTQQSPRATLHVLREIRRRTNLPVRWVVNTHWHGDHTWGNRVYADTFPDARFLATPATRDTLAAAWHRQVDQQREHTHGTRGRLQDMLAEEADPDRIRRIEAAIQVRNDYLGDLDSLEIVLPEPAVADSLRLDVGGREVVLLNVGPAHTPGDLVVYLPDADLMAVGDIVEEGELWLEGADIDGWVDALGHVLEREPDYVLPSHGGLHSDLELVRSQRMALMERVEEVSPP